MKNKIFVSSFFFVILSFVMFNNLDTVSAESMILEGNMEYSHVKVKPIYLNHMIGNPTVDDIFDQNILEDKFGNNIPIEGMELDNINFSKPGVYVTNVFYSVNDESLETEVPVIILNENGYCIQKPIYLNHMIGNPTVDDIFDQNILEDKFGNNIPIEGMELDNINFFKPGVYVTSVSYSINEESFEIEVPVIVTNYL